MSIRWSQAHINVGLTNFSTKIVNEEFKCRSLLPTVPVKKDSDKYWEYGDEHLKRVLTRRADKSESVGIKWSLSSTSYECEPYAAHTEVSERDRKNADSGIAPEQDAVMLTKEAVDLDIEMRIASFLTSTSNITNYTPIDGTNGVDWDAKWDDSTEANSRPLDAIAYGVNQIHSKAARTPNTLAMDWDTWRHFYRHPQIQEKLKYQYGKEAIEGIFVPPKVDNLNLVVVASAYDSSKSGQDMSSLKSVWGDTVLIAYIDPSPRWGTNTLGVTFSSGGPIVRKWHDSPKNCDVVEFEEQGLDWVLTNANCGYLLTDVLS